MLWAACNQKRMPGRPRATEPIDRSSESRSSQNADLSVAGHIECDRATVSGGLLSVCCRLWKGDVCLLRNSADGNIITIVNSEHCKWCKAQSVRGARDRHRSFFCTGEYLRGLFKVKVSEAARLAELIAELTDTQGWTADHSVIPVTGTPPYCTVADVRHISSVALAPLLAFDDEFVWGDNLTFNTKAQQI